MKGHFSTARQHSEVPTYRSVPRTKAFMLHPDMFAGHSKEHEALIPTLMHSVRMRSMKQHSTQIRFKKDYDDMYDPDPSRKLAMLRNARLRRGRGSRADPSLLTWSDSKQHQQRSDSFSVGGLKRTRLDLSDCVIDKVANVFETEKFNTSVISSDLRGILGEVNRVISTVTNAAGRLNSERDDRLRKGRPHQRVRRVSNLPEMKCEDCRIES